MTQPSNSSLDRLIPPEITGDALHELLRTLAADPRVRTILEIGSSAGQGSTAALVAGAHANPNRATVYCIELSTARFDALTRAYGGDAQVRCYNVSSVPGAAFPSEEEVTRFWQQTNTVLRKYPLEQVLGWLRDDRAYLASSGLPQDGIEMIRRERGIDRFDLVLIDGSEFTGRAELELVYGARFIVLDDVMGFKNAHNYARLSADPTYLVRAADMRLRNGYAFFERIFEEPPATMRTEPRERNLVLGRVREGMTVFDVGANVGDYTILFSKIVGDQGRVFAFEPASSTAEKLRKRLEQHECRNVHVEQCAVWRENGEIDFNEFADEYSVWNSIGRPTMRHPENLRDIVPFEKVEKVAARRLDDFCKERGVEFIDYLKLDVEGAESDALAGAGELLSRQAIGVIQFEISLEMLRGMSRSAKQVFDVLHAHGYVCHELRDDGGLGVRATDSESYYENYVAVPALPVHFFTIVLNGEPFIRHHIEQFAKLPFNWHWHIVEGVADLKHDTAWSLRNGARVPNELHRQGRSIDGTSAYLDELAAKFPGNVSIYRKPPRQLWDGKLEMVNAPLKAIDQECLLWEIDADELWTAEQLAAGRKLFVDHPSKTAAYYWCWFFVGPDRVVSTRGGYGNNPAQDWVRTWRCKPGMVWAAHEPPVLAEPVGGNNYRNVAAVDPLRHDETERAGLVFEHYAYATLEQVRFKQAYYGYANAMIGWAELQYAAELPAKLREHMPWVNDDAKVDRAEKFIASPLMKLNLQSASGTTGGAAKKPVIVIDGVFFQMFMTGIARLWWSLLTEWTRDGFAEHIVLLDRVGTMPPLPGVRRRVAPLHHYGRMERDREFLQQICDEEGAELFVSTYYTTPTRTPSMLMLYDMIPEVTNLDMVNDPMWVQKKSAIAYASSFAAISHNTKRDLMKFYPNVAEENVTVAHCGVWPVFRQLSRERVDEFRKRFAIRRPYFLFTGTRAAYKNARLLFRAFSQFSRRDEFQILCVGGEPQMDPELLAMAPAGAVQFIGRVSDEDLCAAYVGAAALVFPSYYEGFGLPIAEAFASGCPVITSARGSVTEVGGEAAIYVDPDDPAELARAMERVLDPRERERLIAAGLEQVKQFRWDTMAGKVRDVMLATVAR